MQAYRKESILHYQKEREALTPKEIQTILEQGKKWNLSKILENKGALFFPHVSIKDCGDQVAAVVQNCLETQADNVIVMGVLHSLTNEWLRPLREQERAKILDFTKNKGILGPDFGPDTTWKNEFSLQNFLFLWEHEIRLRGIKKPPRLIECYICPTNCEPWKLPYLDRLKAFLPNSVVVATGDLFHHGIGYSPLKKHAIPISPAAEMLARCAIKEGFQCMERGDYEAYYIQAVHSLSDAIDVGQLLIYLLGPLKGEIIDLRLVDTSSHFENNLSPNWVAVTLASLTPKNEF